MADFGDHDHDTHLLSHRTYLVSHLVVGRQLVERGLQLSSRAIGSRGRPEVHSHEKLIRVAVTELLQIQDVAAVGGEYGCHGMDNAWLIGAGQCQDLILVRHTEISCSVMKEGQQEAIGSYSGKD